MGSVQAQAGALNQLADQHWERVEAAWGVRSCSGPYHHVHSHHGEVAGVESIQAQAEALHQVADQPWERVAAGWGVWSCVGPYHHVHSHLGKVAVVGSEVVGTHYSALGDAAHHLEEVGGVGQQTEVVGAHYGALAASAHQLDQ